MAQYTIELRTLLQTGYDIGLDDYPIPDFADESWREALNKKIVNHYYFDEICHTAPDRWKQFLNNTMREIMPVKCLQYEALHNKFGFFTGATETFQEATTGKGESTDSGTSETQANSSDDRYTLGVSSATPAAMLNTESEIEANTYADAANKTKEDYSSTSSANVSTEGSRNSSNEGTRLYTRKWDGVPGKSYAALYKEYIDSVNNVDMEVIQALSSCFMGVF